MIGNGIPHSSPLLTYDTMSKKKQQHFQLGDSVKLIFTDETGKVTRIIDSESVMVRLSDGDQIPVFNEHLELLESMEARLKLEKQPATKQPEKAKAPPPPTAEELKKQKEEAAKKILQMGMHLYEDAGPDLGIHLALQPFYQNSGIIDYFLVHLTNNTPRAITFTYEAVLDDEVFFSITKTLPSREAIILNDVQFDWLNEYLSLEIKGEVKAIQSEETSPLNFEKIITPKAKMLRNPPHPVPLLPPNALAYSFVVLHKIGNPTEKMPPKPEPLIVDPAELKLNMLLANDNKEEGNSNRVNLNSEERVIDLHIEKLQASYKHLTNSEILNIQLRAFEKSLLEAIKNKEKTMAVIHGKGSGKLRTEIFNLLRSYPQAAHYTNDYHHKYEFGATIITFDHN